jgi:hypothetical protein
VTRSAEPAFAGDIEYPHLLALPEHQWRHVEAELDRCAEVELNALTKP